MGRTAFALVAAVAVFGLAGCYETSTPKQYEPGVYKGDEDPLLEKIAAKGHHEELAERFRTVQTDR